MGSAEEFLNIRITQRPGQITIDQEPLSSRSINVEIMLMCRRCLNTCHEMSHPQQRSNGNSSQSFPYPAIVGSLLYLAVVTRPDLMFAVGVLTHHLKSPTYASCKAACRVLNYLSHHPAISICYSLAQFTCLHRLRLG
jgi:hypothetical protein